jgi:hypothetical protein
MAIPTRLRVASTLTFCLGALLLSPGSAAAQGAECPPGSAYTVTFTVHDDGEAAPLVATHDVRVLAEWSGDDVEQTRLSVPEGVRVLGTRPRDIRVVAPRSASLAVTATWVQPASPFDPSSTARCVATQTMALPVLAPRPPRPVYDIRGAGFDALSFFAVVPDRDRPDLSPITISSRVAKAARFPSASAVRTMTVPMLEADVVKYRARLPGAESRTTPIKCRLFSLTCGRLTTDVYALGPLRRVTKRALRAFPGDLLARTQPRRRDARNGLVVLAYVHSIGFRGPRTVGYDVQVRQSGELVARVRRAARCDPEVRFGFKRLTCRVLRKRNG